MKKFILKRGRINYFLVGITYCLIFTFQSTIIAQTNLVFHVDETGTNVMHQASKNIKFLPGYHYTPDAVNKQHSFIDLSNTVFQNTYSGFSDEMFDNREINTGLVVGSVQGEHSVSSFGGAAYTIPINLPPGTNDLVPKLTLQYNSHNLRNSVGVGWSLTGISRIARTTSSFHLQSNVSPISTSNDQFELDGKRFSKNIFTQQLQFESEKYEKITFVSGGGFIVQTKQGITLEYGTTADSRFSGLFWNINKIIDNHGNYISFAYVNNHIVEIKYTGNINTGLLPYNSIKFFYKPQADVGINYYDGNKVFEEEILGSIEVFSEGSVVKTYQFNYDFNLYSYLTEIVQKGNDGSELNSTIINYEEIGTPNSNYVHSGIPLQDAEYRAGDFNGDGKADLVAFTFNLVPNPNGTGTVRVYQNYKLYINLGNGSYNEVVSNGALPPNFFPFDPSSPMSQLATRNAGIEAVDLNGDGLEDLLLASLNNNHVTYTPFYSTGIDFDAGDPIHINASTNNHTLLLGDFDGDGKVDAFVHKTVNSNNFWEVYIFSGSLAPNTAFNNQNQYQDINNTLSFNLDFSNFVILDFNGDGKTDILTFKNSNTLHPGAGIFTLNDFLNPLGPTLKEIYTNQFVPSKNNFKRFGDFNGDKKTDLLSSNGTDFFILYSTGTDFDNALNTTTISGLDLGTFNIGLNYFVLDFNGDGKADVLKSSNIGTTTALKYYDIFYSNGINFSQQSYSVKTNFNEPAFEFADFDGNGSQDVFFKQTNVSLDFTLTNTRLKLIRAIKDGFNNETKFSYDPLTNIQNTIYTKGNNAIFPVSDIQPTLYVVSSVTKDDGIGGVDETTYLYEGAKFHRSGKGFLGFSKVIAQNSIQNKKSITELEFDNVFYHLVPKRQSTFLLTTGVQISEKTFINNTSPRFSGSDVTNFKFFLSQVTSIITKDFLTNHTVTSNFVYDNFGNIIETNTTKGTLETIHILNQYGTHGTFIPASLESSIITKTRTGEVAITRKIISQYNNLGDVVVETEDPNTPRQKQTNFSYDVFGNSNSKAVVAPNASTRAATMIYDVKGRYAKTITNAIGQASFITYDPKYGKPLSIIGIDGLVTSFVYDAFGRLMKKITPDNIIIEIQLAWDIGGGLNGTPTTVDNTVFTSTTTITGEPTTKFWFDSFGRKRKSIIDGFNNPITVVTSYDVRSNVSTKTSPFFIGDIPVITQNTYDDLNRISSVQNSAGTSTFNYLFGNETSTTTVVLPDNTTSSVTKDATDLLISATDAGGILNYTYYSSGLQKNVKLNGQIMITVEYDLTGNQTKLMDKNAGTTNYEYNGFGELTKQTSANQKITNMTYDVLGRITSKANQDGVNTYTYVVNGNGLNQLQTVNNTNGISTLLNYDNLNRIISQTENVDNEVLITQFGYDAFNKINSIIYPSGFQIKNEYNAVGYPTKVTDATGTVTIWQAQNVNALNQYTSYSLGNGITSNKTFDEFGLPVSYNTPGIQELNFVFDKHNGNLLSREDIGKGLLEEFSYDNLNRLTESKLNSIIQMQQSYASNGNITNKTDAGIYSYPNTKVNAVVGVTNSNSEIGLMQQNITYTSFNKTASIIEDVNQLNFTYNPQNERIKTALTVNGNLSYTRYYSGSYEKQVSNNGNQITEVHYINGADGLVAMYVIENNVGTYYYTYTDYLGSILTLTDDAGVIVAEQNFDAWGRNRNPSDWSFNNIPTNPSWLWRGFTGHEHLTTFALINMNGRIYDPILARMLSPDNFVQDPLLTQNFNRYSYAINNPLKFVDASGDVFFSILVGALVGGIVNAILNKEEGDDSFNFVGDFLFGAIGGGLGGGLFAGGIVGNVLIAGVIGGTSTGTLNVLFASTIEGETDLGNLITLFRNGLIAGLAGTTVSALVSPSPEGLKFSDKATKIFENLKQINSLKPTTFTQAIGSSGVGGGLKVLNSGADIDNIGDVFKIGLKEFALSLPFKGLSNVPAPLRSGLKSFTEGFIDGKSLSNNFFDAGTGTLIKAFSDEALRLGITAFGVDNPPTFPIDIAR